MTQRSIRLPLLRGNSRAASIFRITLVLFLGALAVPLVERSLFWIAGLMVYPYPADGLEGTLLSQADLLWNGQPLYQPFELYRFVSSPYPLWHPLILGLANQVTGQHAFWSGRVVSLVTAFGVLATIALTVRVISRSWLAALLSAALMLGFPPLVLWATRIKPDMYALLWTALGLLAATWAITPPNEGGRKTGRARLSTVLSITLSAVCFALAFFTKQTALAGPLAAGLAFVIDDLQTWRTGQHRRLVFSPRTWLFGASYASIVSVTWLLLDVWSSGQFTFHIWTQHRNALWTQDLMLKFVALLAYTWPLVLLGLGALVLAWREPRARVVACYALIAPLTLYGAGKTGANHNHLLETLLALALTGGIVFGWGMQHLARRPLLASAAIGVFAVQLALAFSPPAWYEGELVLSGTPERFTTFIETVPGEVLADDPGLLYMLGRPLRYDDPSGIGPVAHSGLWDQRGLIDDITQQRFGAILIPVDVEIDTIDPSGRWTPEMIAAIKANYTVLYRDTTMVYVPK